MERQNNSESWSITYHFVWGPMRAKACLTDEIAERLQELIAAQAGEFEFIPVALVVFPDRVYLAAAAPPTLAPHSIVCQVKAYTSRILREEFPELTRIPSLWTRSYVVMAGDSLDMQTLLVTYDSTLPERKHRGRPRKNESPDEDEKET
jgi:putative transposase